MRLGCHMGLYATRSLLFSVLIARACKQLVKFLHMRFLRFVVDLSEDLNLLGSGNLKSSGMGRLGTGRSLKYSPSQMSRIQVRCAFADSLAESECNLCELQYIPLSSAQLFLRFEQFVDFLARCAWCKYETVGVMGLGQMVDGLVDNLLSLRSEEAVVHQATDILRPPLLDPLTCDDCRLPGEDPVLFEACKMSWITLHLDSLPGFPLWEKELFELIHASFGRLCSVFDIYCHSAGEDDEDAFVMSLGEWSSFCREIKVGSKAFPHGRAESVFRFSMLPEFECLMLPQFVEALVHLSFQRFHPEPARRPLHADNACPRLTVSESFRRLLEEFVYPYARHDDPHAFRRVLAADDHASRLVKEYSPSIFRMLHGEGYLSEGSEDKVALSEALDLARKRGLLGRHVVNLQGGKSLVASLSEPQLRYCFLNARGGAAARVLGVGTLAGNELIQMLAQCGDMAFSTIPNTKLHRRVEAFFQVLLCNVPVAGGLRRCSYVCSAYDSTVWQVPLPL